jgi:hypothetical protein
VSPPAALIFKESGRAKDLLAGYDRSVFPGKEGAMDRTTVMNMLSLIPERSTRRQSGSFFEAREGRIANLSRFLNWLCPLNPITKEDQEAIGYRVAPPRAEEPEGDEGPDDEPLTASEPEPVRLLQEEGSHF